MTDKSTLLDDVRTIYEDSKSVRERVANQIRQAAYEGKRSVDLHLDVETEFEFHAYNNWLLREGFKLQKVSYEDKTLRVHGWTTRHSKEV